MIEESTTEGCKMKIINKSAFKEAQYLATLATLLKSGRVHREAYWDAAMTVLREAYRG